jgi:hypothetical protein
MYDRTGMTSIRIINQQGGGHRRVMVSLYSGRALRQQLALQVFSHPFPSIGVFRALQGGSVLVQSVSVHRHPSRRQIILASAIWKETCVSNANLQPAGPSAFRSIKGGEPLLCSNIPWAIRCAFFFVFFRRASDLFSDCIVHPSLCFAFCSFRWTSAAHTQRTLTRVAGVNLRPNRCRRSWCLCVWGGLRKRSGGTAFARAPGAGREECENKPFLAMGWNIARL